MPNRIFIVMKVCFDGCKIGDGRKLRNARKKVKGQLVFEFLVAVLIFFGILFYVLNYLGSSVSSYREAYASESMGGLSYKIGELLAMNKGNWTGASPRMVPGVLGLAEDWPVLNYSKIQSLQWYCNNRPEYYDDLKRKLSLGEERNFGIVINEINRSGGIVNMVNCPQDEITCSCRIPKAIRRSEVKMYGVLDTNGNVIVIYSHVW